MISLYGPFTPHVVARRFAGEQNLPWVALQKDYYSRPDSMTTSLASRAANELKRRFERRTIGYCDALLPVNENMAAYYQGLVPNSTTMPLTHCFDEEDFAAAGQDDALDENVFRVLSLGLIHKLDHYGLGVFFQALGELLNEGSIDSKDFRARFVGHGGEIARSYARLHNCESILETVLPLAHDEAMRELRQASCLFFQQVHLGGRRRLPEYLASRKPILAFPEDPGTMSDRVIREYGAAAVTNSKDEIKTALLDWYRAFKEHGRLDLPVNEEVVKSFSATHKALELGNILRSVTEKVTEAKLA